MQPPLQLHSQPQSYLVIQPPSEVYAIPSNMVSPQARPQFQSQFMSPQSQLHSSHGAQQSLYNPKLSAPTPNHGRGLNNSAREDRRTSFFFRNWETF